MSKITKEIEGCMSQLGDDEKGLIAHFCFPKGFIGFKGHFPGRPVLPGVCKIQAMLCMLEASAHRVPRLKEIVSAKFFAPVTCNEEIVFTVRRVSKDTTAVQASALVMNGDKKIAEIKLRVVFEA
jgi:3-hydroxymyristoyl/3-hydroxydecanoyl-(acyl carrier protein) dehydratase